MMAEENENSGEKSPPPAADAPEVEAEIVTDDDIALSRVEINDGFSGSEDTPSTPPPQKKTKLPRRAIMLGVGIIAVFGVGFVVWRLLPREPQPVLPTDVVSEQDGQKSVTAPEAIPNEIPSPSKQDKAAPSAPSKITNDIDFGAAAKEAGLDAPEEGSSADETFLPPLPATDKIEAGNQSLEEAAKEALGISGPVASEEENNNIRPGKEQSGAPAFELEDAGELTSGDTKEQGATSGAVVNGLENSDTENDVTITPEDTGDLTPVGAAPEPMSDKNFTKISNDIETIKDAFRAEIAGLKSSLVEERERDATQSTEIEAMRRNFEAALEARDQRANTEITALKARLDKIQNDDGIAAGRRAAATIALGALQRAIDRGEPYAKELQVFAGLTPNASELVLLRRFADTGAPTLTALKEEFGSIAREAMAASRNEAATGFWGKLWARAQSLINVRPAKPVAGDSAPAILSRAEDHIKYGDVSACLAELESLPPSAQKAIRGWMETARVRADIDDAIEVLFKRLMSSTK